MICAKFRDNSKLRTKRIDKELSRTCCIRARDSEYQQRLSQLIVGTAMEKRPSLKADLLNKKQIPYGTMPNIVKRLRSEGITTTRTTLTATFAADFDIDTWKQYIEENFDNLYALYRHTPKPPTRSGATVMKEEIFAVPIPFNRLLNEELGHEETTVFKNLLYTAARQVTHSIATITMAARIQVIHYASHGFKESSSSRHIPITNLCPVSSVRDTTQLLDGRMIPVSPPDTNLQQMMNNDDDIKQYLDFNHLSFMMNNINKHSNATTHRTWRKCLEQVNLNPSYIMSGKNKLKASEIRLLSTSVNNMWRKSKMYWNVLGHLSRLLIRLHLAPKRELKRYTKISGAKSDEHAATIDVHVDKEEEDEDDNNNNNDNNDNVVNSKDITYKRVLLLSRILRDLVHDDDYEDSIKRVIKRHTLCSNEESVIRQLVSILRPYAARKMDHPVFMIPMVVLGVHVLTACGYKMFVPSIFPMISPATIHSIGLDERILYEIANDRFMIPLDDNSFMTNIVDAEDHPDMIFKAFFNMEYIEQHKRRNQQFDHRITFHPNTDMFGVQYIEQRRKSDMEQLTNDRDKKNSFSDSQCIPTVEWDDQSGPLQLKELQNERRKQQNKLKSLHNSISNAKAELRTLSDIKKLSLHEQSHDDQQQDLHQYNDSGIQQISEDFLALDLDGTTHDNTKSSDEEDTIHMLKIARAHTYDVIDRLSNDISDLNIAKYASSKKKEQKKQPEKERQRLILKHGNYKGVASADDLDARGIASGDLSFAGTDKGIVQMAITAPVTMDRVRLHINLFNQEQDQDDISYNDMKLPDTFKINAREVDYECGTTAHMKAMQQRKKLHTMVSSYEKEIKNSNPLLEKDVDEYGKTYIKVKDHLQSFYYSKNSRHWNRWKYHRTRRGYDRIAAREREFVKEGKNKIVIHCIGNAGTGVGSRIKGHRRRGGKVFERLHGRFTTVAITDEYRTTKLCPYCYKTCVYPMQGKHVQGKVVKKRSLGSVVCVNPRCPAKKYHYTTRSRDKQAAVAIGLVGASQMLNNANPPQRLPPYSRVSVNNRKHHIVRNQ